MTNYNGMQMQNENGRSPEFKNERDKVVADANAFLDELRGIQTDGKSTKAGILADVPRLKHTSMGKTGPNRHLLVTEFTPGAALYQQKPETGGPYTLESVRVDGEKTEVTHVSGTPEVSRLLSDVVSPISNQGRREIVTSFGVQDLDGDGSSMQYDYDFYGDGAVTKRFIDMRGTSVSVPVSTVEGIQMAQAALDDIKASIL